MSNQFTESVVEAAALEWFGELGDRVIHGPDIAPGEPAAERDSCEQVVLEGRLREALATLNPGVPQEGLDEAFRKLTRISSPQLVDANHELHHYLINGVAVEYLRGDGTISYDPVRVAENESWANNATAEFVGRFQIFLGGTAVPRVGERQAFRTGSEPASDELPAKEWHPTTGREHLECVLAALERLTNLAGRGVAELEGDFVSAAKDLSMMLRDGPVRSADTVGRDLRVLSGYVSATRTRRGDDWYDGWVQAQSHRTPRPLHMLFEVAWRCGATPLVARCVHEILESEPVAPEIVGQLSFGRWGENLDPDLLADLLRAMVDAGHEATALTILEHRTKSQPAEHDRWLDLALEREEEEDLRGR